MDASAIWQRVKKWYHDQPYEPVEWFENGVPKEQPEFFSPASEADIAHVEQVTGIHFPDALRNFYMIHAGTSFGWLPEGMWLLTLDGMLKNWKAFTELCEEFPPEDYEETEDGTHWECVYDPWRLPIATREDGPELFLDFRPGSKGSVGQVLYLINECDFVVVGKSFEDFLEKYLLLLESGSLKYANEYGYPLPTDDRKIYKLFNPA